MPSSTRSGTGPWSTPVNLSVSGAASQPVVAAAPDGTFHVLWWDSVAGEQYAYTRVVSDTWSKRVTMPYIFGQRRVTTDAQTGNVTVALVPPSEVRALTDNNGELHVLWSDTQNQLLSTSVISVSWRPPTVLAEVATAMDVTSDPVGNLQLVYARPVDSPGSPSGVYYRAITTTGWTNPRLVYPSLYFRTAKTGNLHLSVAADGQGRVIVVWDDPHLGDSLYALSRDGGATWESPRRVVDTSTGLATRASVAYTIRREFFMLWRETNASGCGFTQIRSNDGLQTWTAPERSLIEMRSCPDRWSLVPDGNGRMWFSGLIRATTSNLVDTPTTPGKGILAVWDGQKWSELVDVSLSSYDATSKRILTLGFDGIAFAGQTIAVVTRDASGDVWTAHNAVSDGELMPALTSAWVGMDTLSNDGESVTPGNVPALAPDGEGKMYALWSQTDNTNSLGTSLFAAVWNGTNWSHAARVLRSPVRLNTGDTGAQVSIQAEQPSMVADGKGKLHAVWVGGENGELLYSSAYARDATTAQGWVQPIKLPALSAANSRPDIIADPRNAMLYVLAAVPYNEKRGIYMFRSGDGGVNWLTPTTVFDAQAAGWNRADKPRVALDANANVLHAVWLRANLPGTVEPAAVFYSRSSDGGQSWTLARMVATGAIDWPQVAIAGVRQVYLSWSETTGQNASGSSTNMLVGEFSPDGGERWTEATRVRGFENLSGPAGLASDRAGHIYVSAMGQQTSGESALLFAQWSGQAWSPYESLLLGQPATPGNTAVLAALPGAGRLGVIIQQWRMGQGGAGRFVITAMERKIANGDPLPLPAFTPMPTSVPTSEPTATQAPTARPQLSQSSTLPTDSANSSQGPWALILSGALAALMVAGAVAFRALKHRSS